MTDILETKKRMFSEKCEAYKEMCGTIQKDLENWVKTLTGEEGVVSKPTLATYSSWKHEAWEIRTTISYPCQDPERKAKGWTTEFGTDVSVYIYPSHIEVNRGCIGNYRKTDKGQVFRDTFLSELWKSESDIIDMMKDDVNVDLLQEKELLYREIENILDDQRRENNRIKREGLIKKIKEAKFLINTYETYDYQNNKLIKKYGNIYRIDKITEKTIFRTQVNEEGKDSYYHTQERYKLEMAISALKCNNMVASDVILQGEVPTQSE